MKKSGLDSVHSWVIASLCCFITSVFIGIFRLTSFLFVASMPRYEAHREVASFPYILCASIINFSGPFVGFFVLKFGQRVSACIGCALAAIGVGCCFLAESIVAVSIFWGVIYAIGYVLCSNVLPVFIIQYFDKQRGRASALSSAGFSLGAFVFSPIYEIFLAKYGLSGTFLLLSGFLAQCIPAALLLKETDFLTKKTMNNTVPDTKNGKHSREKELFFKGTEKTKQSLVDSSLDRKVQIDPEVEFSESVLRISFPSETERENEGNTQHQNEKELMITENTGVIKGNLNHNAHDHDKENWITNAKEKHISENGNNSNRSKEKKLLIFKEWRIFLDPIFQLIVFTKSLNMFLMGCFVTIIVDFAKDINIEERYHKYVPFSLATGEIVGLLLFGWVFDKKCITTSGFMAISFFGLGIAKVGIAFSSELYSFNVFLSLNGVFTALSLFLFPLYVADFFENDKQIMTISSGTLYAGPAGLFISYLIGFFREHIGSYKYMLLFLTGMHWLGGSLLLATPCIDKCRKENLKQPR